jgi:hypothetical protein
MNQLVAWLRERMPARRFVPLALLLTLLGGPLDTRRIPLALLAWLLLATFRLRDDLADRERDRQRAPERVLVRTPALRPFSRAWALGFVVALAGVVLAQGLVHARMLVWLGGAFELAYGRALGGRHRWVLLKYPAFVLLLAERIDLETAGIAALVYLSLALFERIDDPELAARPHAPLRASACPLLAGVLGTALLVDAAATWPWLAALALACTAALALLHTQRPRLAPLALGLATLLVWAQAYLPSTLTPGSAHARDPALLCLRQ